MAEVWIAADEVFDGASIVPDAGVRVRDGVVAEVAPAPASAPRIDGLIAPGFVDLQVNGGGGVLLNATPTRAGIAAIVAAHRAAGTMWIMPTVITDHPDVLEQAVAACLAARNDPGVIGLHIEGPHISPARKGTHAAAHIRPLDAQTLALAQRLRDADVPVMLTLAPEAATLDQIASLAAMGVVVSLGHTDAAASEIDAALAAGATCGTHLFNAMSQMQGRAPGAVGAILTADCFAGIISDGHHVADSMVGLALRARPVPDRTFLVSDAMPTVGGPDSFTLYGKDIQLQNGRLVNADGALAGAHTTQAEGLTRLVTSVGVARETALRMVTSVPAACIGLPGLGHLIGRPLDEVIVLDDDMRHRGDLISLGL